MKSKFESWFQQQPFYLNLRFIHGERLFIFDAQDGYVVQAVQIAWETWKEQQKRVDELKETLKKISDWSSHEDGLEASHGAWGVRDFYRNLAEQALKGGVPQVQDPQACDHTMAEKTQFGDLHRTFECIFCDHKTTEAWVTNE